MENIWWSQKLKQYCKRENRTVFFFFNSSYHYTSSYQFTGYYLCPSFWTDKAILVYQKDGIVTRRRKFCLVQNIRPSKLLCESPLLTIHSRLSASFQCKCSVWRYPTHGVKCSKWRLYVYKSLHPITFRAYKKKHQYKKNLQRPFKVFKKPFHLPLYKPFCFNFFNYETPTRPGPFCQESWPWCGSFAAVVVVSSSCSSVPGFYLFSNLPRAALELYRIEKCGRLPMRLVEDRYSVTFPRGHFGPVRMSERYSFPWDLDRVFSSMFGFLPIKFLIARCSP